MLRSRLDSFVALQPAMFRFQVRNPKLGALASSLLGPDVSLSPLQHLRPHMGTPAAAAVYAELEDGEEGGRFWHQDQSVTMVRFSPRFFPFFPRFVPMFSPFLGQWGPGDVGRLV